MEDVFCKPFRHILDRAIRCATVFPHMQIEATISVTKLFEISVYANRLRVALTSMINVQICIDFEIVSHNCWKLK